MALQQDLGSFGEQLAVALLERKSYRIAERNWRWRRAEVDIIAWDGDILVFIEVKARTHLQHGWPEEAITRRKMQILAQAAGAYMRQCGHEWQVRFDSVAVEFSADGRHSVQHFEDIWFPGRDE